jgi:type II secretory pathway pseudopilin PulG
MRPRRRGYVLLDVTAGLSIVVLLAGVLTVSAGRQQRATRRLDDQRKATALAERTLTNLQIGQAAPANGDDAKVEILEAKGATAPAGKRWVEVRAKLSGRTSELVGLVPANVEPTTKEGTAQ